VFHRETLKGASRPLTLLEIAEGRFFVVAAHAEVEESVGFGGSCGGCVGYWKGVGRAVEAVVARD